MRRLLLCLALIGAVGCASLPPPRPLAADQVYVCIPGSALPRRITVPAGFDASALRQKRGSCAHG
jgi:hypothetical protein